ncbi:MAG: YdcF family protein [Nitrospira sp.]|nr:YdcF family protein [Nitrospira sp.]
MEVIAKYLVLPSSLMTISLLAGLVLLLFRRTKRGLWVGLGGVVIYLVFGAGPLSFLLLGALEFRIPPADPTEREKAEAIVVLAGYGEADPDHPLSSRVNGTSAIRLLETVMLYKSRPTTTVFVSGYDDVARIMRDIIVSAGVPDDQVITDAASKNTYESAVHLAPMLGNKRFLLVTSAGHMPRAMGVFLKAGTHPLPVPTDYMTKRNPLATTYLPSPLHLHYSDLAMSEYAALAWYSLKGRV